MWNLKISNVSWKINQGVPRREQEPPLPLLPACQNGVFLIIFEIVFILFKANTVVFYAPFPTRILSIPEKESHRMPIIIVRGHSKNTWNFFGSFLTSTRSTCNSIFLCLISDFTALFCSTKYIIKRVSLSASIVTQIFTLPKAQKIMSKCK